MQVDLDRLRHKGHMPVTTTPEPGQARGQAAEAIEDQVGQHAPHWLQTLMLGYVALFSTVILESAGESSLNHALEHADMHSLHCTHFSVLS